jgi:hypothetical protein
MVDTTEIITSSEIALGTRVLLTAMEEVRVVGVAVGGAVGADASAS